MSEYDEFLGHTLPDLLERGRSVAGDRPETLNDWRGGRWTGLSLDDFHERSQDLALGLVSLGLSKDDAVALLVRDDLSFCIPDMACLMAGLPDVPLYLTNSAEANAWILDDAEAVALIVADLELLESARELVAASPGVRTVLLVDSGADVLEPPEAWPTRASLLTVADVSARGRRIREHDPAAPARMKEGVEPEDLATLIYTSGTTGRPKGVMLSHQNISSNALSIFSELPDLGRAPDDRALSFLPLTHAFARTLWYGCLQQAVPIYFTVPQRLPEHLREVRPTFMVTVPRVLERLFEKICTAGSRLTGLRRQIFSWALELAERTETQDEPETLERIQLATADHLIYSKWREATGGRLDLIVSGGAALDGKLVRSFSAAGMPIVQGFGLTEASPVVTTNRPGRANRSGTVGQALKGVEVRIADDGEVLTRGPHVMMGYHGRPRATAECIDEDGWLHTGDVGVLDEDGFLTITDRKKDLFKLSTGEYVTPAPLESRMAAEPLVAQAVVVGPGRKYCAALIFPDMPALRLLASRRQLPADLPRRELLSHPEVLRRFQDIVDAASAHFPDWVKVKRFLLVDGEVSVEAGLLTPTLKVRRDRVCEAFSEELEELYLDDEPDAHLQPISDSRARS